MSVHPERGNPEELIRQVADERRGQQVERELAGDGTAAGRVMSHYDRLTSERLGHLRKQPLPLAQMQLKGVLGRQAPLAIARPDDLDRAVVIEPYARDLHGKPRRRELAAASSDRSAVVRPERAPEYPQTSFIQAYLAGSEYVDVRGRGHRLPQPRIDTLHLFSVVLVISRDEDDRPR